MKKLLIGRKLGMTQIFAEDGGSVPVTVIEAEPSVVIQKKTQKTPKQEIEKAKRIMKENFYLKGDKNEIKK